MNTEHSKVNGCFKMHDWRGRGFNKLNKTKSMPNREKIRPPHLVTRCDWVPNHPNYSITGFTGEKW